MPILNFGVSTTILNPVDIFCGRCKLKLELLQCQVKSYHFSERIEAISLLFVLISWKNLLETTLGNPFGYCFGFITAFYMEMDKNGTRITLAGYQRYLTFLLTTFTFGF